MEVYSHDGKAVNVTMEPGTLICSGLLEKAEQAFCFSPHMFLRPPILDFFHLGDMVRNLFHRLGIRTMLSILTFSLFL